MNTTTTISVILTDQAFPMFKDVGVSRPVHFVDAKRQEVKSTALLHTARRTMKEPDADLGFERGHRLTHRRGRHFKIGRGQGKTAAASHGKKGNISSELLYFQL